MKKIITILFVCGLASLAFSQNFGVDQSSPSQKLDVNGWIEIGNETAGSTGTAGTIRYHSSGILQFHNGTQWIDVPGIVPGTIYYFANNTVPAGYLACNGAAVSRTTYARLFASIGTTYGAGDGSTTFNVPDLRGEFVRGLDNGRGVDPSRTIGSFQNYDWKGFNMYNTGQNTTAYSHGPIYMGKTTASYTGNLFIGYWAAPAAALGMLWDASEIRPRNVALLACIKH